MIVFDEIMIDPVLKVGAVVVLFALFMLSAIEKFRDIETFQVVLDGYKLIPPALVNMLAIAIPLLELTSALCLVVQAMRPLGIALTSSLLLIYALVIGISVLRGLQGIDCGCGTDHVPISWALFFRNISLLALPAIASLPLLERQYVWMDVGLTILLVIFSMATYSLVNVLIKNDSLFQQLDS